MNIYRQEEKKMGEMDELFSAGVDDPSPASLVASQRRGGNPGRRILVAVDAAGLDPVADALLLGRPVDGRLDAVLGERPQDAVLLFDAAVRRQDRVVGRLQIALAEAQPGRGAAPAHPLVVRVLEEF